MTPTQKQLLLLVYDKPKNLGLQDMLDPDIKTLIDFGYAERDGQELSITDEGKAALLAEQQV